MADITLTQEQLAQLKPSPQDLAMAVRMAREAELAEASNRSAQERIVMGAFSSWFKHNWKVIVTLGTIVLTVAGGVYRGWLWLQTEAETSVLERQASDKQATAVDANTNAVSDLTSKSEDLDKRMGTLETEMKTTKTMNELILELQLRDPKIRRLIKTDAALKKKLDQIPSVDIKD